MDLDAYLLDWEGECEMLMLLDKLAFCKLMFVGSLNLC